MATITRRGNAYSVKFTYKANDCRTVQHWESYLIELDAIHRKAHIDYLQKIKANEEITRLALEYRRKRADEKITAVGREAMASSLTTLKEADKLKKTFDEFFTVWLPIHARKKRLSPNTLNSYLYLWDMHIEPYFGDRVMSEITSQDIDDFVDCLSQK